MVRRTTASTRDRILEVAMARFIEHGYEATSLREISEDLGFTKAALYYHFKSKEELLAALLQPGEDVVRELIDRLEAAEGIQGWADALDWVITVMSTHLAFFRLVDRNRTAIESLELKAELVTDHQQMHERVEKAVLTNSSDLRSQVRMVAALGAVTGFDDWAPTLLFETPIDVLQVELRAAVVDILDLAPKPIGRSRKR